MQIEIRDVRKDYGRVQAVRGVSFSVEEGQLLVILGPSGCGKTTLLRLIAGLEPVTSGTIHIAGTDVTHLPPVKRNISMVFQSYALFPHLNVRENIIFGLKVRKVPADEIERRLKRVVDLLGLSGRLDSKPGELSGGMQQRVALGRAIIAEKPVTLMDEPLSNLDAKLRNSMRREICSLQRRLGITMIYVTHDQVEAMTMADRIVLMRDGQIVQDDSPENFYERPANTFVARFIGTPPMNIVPLCPTQGGAALEPGGRLLFPGMDPDRYLFGIRPENLRLAESGQPAMVTGREYLGSDTFVSCEIHGQEVIVRTRGRRNIREGTVVHLTWDPGDVNLFDARTQERVDSVVPARKEGRENPAGSIGG
ncbi:carbohydrate ABC transporter ATP-binding protein, CUT1 family (TC 3.A.1.1.-) [Desulfacinum infernum DSM 9756]|uniref:Carbohydrate ABC transporter ATP-binding protein, CUT1 family (TC 3.A.1.1.-) n=1 Tax=Desulfacinum infernum DSM 9756 TaxID=1121391 RepID=A0A1M4YA38_9BACT|nr:ABC transporter ATP-binding protein [Desulfacinum infernum]SHF02476.1 carbohydrate ABC transporter ATP-binding protein, CUT1 family (TC 3.A.1.1.-) [Desulfacinum infernum DSM 9756]